MLKQRTLLLMAAVIALGVAVGYAIAEGFSGDSPPPVGPVVAATAAPTSPPTATATPTTAPTATAEPTSSPTATAAPPTPSPEPQFTEYTVQQGDTLFAIARRFGVTPEQILAVNTIPDPDNLVVGQVLRIPRP